MTMETLFDELRAAREARGLTLDDIGRETLINIRFLRALEAGDTSIMPQTYVRAFLRAYAACVGIDPVYAMQRLDGMPPRAAASPVPAPPPPAGPSGQSRSAAPDATAVSPLPPIAPVRSTAPGERPTPVTPPVPPPVASSDAPITERPASRREAAGRKTAPLPKSAPPVVPPVSAQSAAPDQTSVAGQTVPPVSAPVEVQPPTLDAAASPVSAELEEAPPFWSQSWVRSAGTTLVVVLGIALIAYFARQPGEPPQEIPFGTALQENVARLTPPDTTAGTVMPQALSPRDSLVLRANTTDSVWVLIARDALPPMEYLFPPGAARTWKARDRFTLSLGNAGGVSFRLNNRDLGKLGKPGVVLRNIELTRETLTSPVKTDVQP